MPLERLPGQTGDTRQHISASVYTRAPGLYLLPRVTLGEERGWRLSTEKREVFLLEDGNRVKEQIWGWKNTEGLCARKQQHK